MKRFIAVTDYGRLFLSVSPKGEFGLTDFPQVYKLFKTKKELSDAVRKRNKEHGELLIFEVKEVYV